MLLALVTDRATDEVSGELKHVLPDYLWPSHCSAVRFGTFPINQNGKIDDDAILRGAR